MRVLACLLPHVSVDGGQRSADGTLDPNSHSLLEARQLQRQVDRRAANGKPGFPVRLHHDYLKRNDDRVGSIERCWVARNPTDATQLSLWGWLNVSDPATAQRIEQGGLPECSPDIGRTLKSTGWIGVKLCPPNDAYFEHTRIYPPAEWHALLGPDTPNESLPTFDTVPHHASQAMADFVTKHKDHMMFPAIEQLTKQYQDCKDDPIAKMDLLKKIKTVRVFIENDAALQEKAKAEAETAKTAQEPAVPLDANTAPPPTGEAVQRTPAQPAEPMQTDADAEAPPTLETTLAENLRLHNMLGEFVHAYEKSGLRGGKRTASQRPDATAEQQLSNKASHSTSTPSAVPSGLEQIAQVVDASTSIW